MSLTIENEETCRLASELAALTGESEADAIADALRERIERQREAEALSRDLRSLGKQTAKLLRGTGLTSTNIGDYLYEEDGLPK